MSANPCGSGLVREHALPYSYGMSEALTPEALATWTDEAIAAAWKRSSWELGEPSADALAAEMERRGLDF